MVHPLHMERQKTSRSWVVYSINQWATRLHISKLRLVSAMANPSQLHSTPLKVNALLSGQELHTECIGQSRGRATLETHFCFVYWGEEGLRWGELGGIKRFFSEDANIVFKLDAKSNLQVFRVEILWSRLLSPMEAEWLSQMVTNCYWLSRTWAQQTSQVEVNTRRWVSLCNVNIMFAPSYIFHFVYFLFREKQQLQNCHLVQISYLFSKFSVLPPSYRYRQTTSEFISTVHKVIANWHHDANTTLLFRFPLNQNNLYFCYCILALSIHFPQCGINEGLLFFKILPTTLVCENCHSYIQRIMLKDMSKWSAFVKTSSQSAVTG